MRNRTDELETIKEDLAKAIRDNITLSARCNIRKQMIEELEAKVKELETALAVARNPVRDPSLN